jgi:hypothetical protein
MPEESQDEFAQAFAEATAGEAPADITPAADTEVAAAPEPEDVPAAAPVTPEPTAALESAPSQPAQTDGSDAEAERRHQEELQRIRTHNGRVIADERRKREELEAEVQRLKNDQSQAKVHFQPDELEKEEIEKFRKANPEVAKRTIDGPKGKLWQKLLVERGSDDLIAQHELVQEGVESVRREVRDEIASNHAKAHIQAIETAHPDLRQVIGNPTPQNPNDLYNHDFVNWVRQLPYDTAKDVVRIMDKGTATEIIETVNAYKEYRQPSGSGQNQTTPAASPKPAPSQKVRAALAVPSRGATPPRPKADPNDFGAAWAEATAQR